MSHRKSGRLPLPGVSAAQNARSCSPASTTPVAVWLRSFVTAPELELAVLPGSYATVLRGWPSSLWTAALSSPWPLRLSPRAEDRAQPGRAPAQQATPRTATFSREGDPTGGPSRPPHSPPFPHLRPPGLCHHRPCVRLVPATVTAGRRGLLSAPPAAVHAPRTGARPPPRCPRCPSAWSGVVALGGSWRRETRVAKTREAEHGTSTCRPWGRRRESGADEDTET